MSVEFDTARIREALNKVFDDSELTAFCLDYFPKIYDKFGSGMRKDEKITLLVDYCRREPNRFQKLLDNVYQEYERSENEIWVLLIEALRVCLAVLPETEKPAKQAIDTSKTEHPTVISQIEQPANSTKNKQPANSVETEQSTNTTKSERKDVSTPEIKPISDNFDIDGFSSCLASLFSLLIFFIVINSVVYILFDFDIKQEIRFLIPNTPPEGYKYNLPNLVIEKKISDYCFYFSCGNNFEYFIEVQHNFEIEEDEFYKYRLFNDEEEISCITKKSKLNIRSSKKNFYNTIKITEYKTTVPSLRLNSMHTVFINFFNKNCKIIEIEVRNIYAKASIVKYNKDDKYTELSLKRRKEIISNTKNIKHDETNYNTLVRLQNLQSFLMGDYER